MKIMSTSLLTEGRSRLEMLFRIQFELKMYLPRDFVWLDFGVQIIFCFRDFCILKKRSLVFS